MVRFGLIVAAIVLILDQATKEWWLALMRANPAGIEIAPFFNLVMVWNHGVSFGLFNDMGSDAQRWLLSGFAVVMSVFLFIWLRRTGNRLVALGLGLVIGGAIGNVIDRLRFGAVADFLDFHVAGWHWPAFNIADAGIVVGAACLLADGLFSKSEKQ
jgi:signal peptidase II